MAAAPAVAPAKKISCRIQKDRQFLVDKKCSNAVQDLNDASEKLCLAMGALDEVLRDESKGTDPKHVKYGLRRTCFEIVANCKDNIASSSAAINAAWGKAKKDFNDNVKMLKDGLNPKKLSAEMQWIGHGFTSLFGLNEPGGNDILGIFTPSDFDSLHKVLLEDWVQNATCHLRECSKNPLLDKEVERLLRGVMTNIISQPKWFTSMAKTRRCTVDLSTFEEMLGARTKLAVQHGLYQKGSLKQGLMEGTLHGYSGHCQLEKWPAADVNDWFRGDQNFGEDLLKLADAILGCQELRDHDSAWRKDKLHFGKVGERAWKACENVWKLPVGRVHGAPDLSRLQAAVGSLSAASLRDLATCLAVKSYDKFIDAYFFELDTKMDDEESAVAPTPKRQKLDHPAAAADAQELPSSALADALADALELSSSALADAPELPSSVREDALVLPMSPPSVTKELPQTLDDNEVEEAEEVEDEEEAEPNSTLVVGETILCLKPDGISVEECEVISSSLENDLVVRSKSSRVELTLSPEHAKNYILLPCSKDDEASILEKYPANRKLKIGGLEVEAVVTGCFETASGDVRLCLQQEDGTVTFPKKKDVKLKAPAVKGGRVQKQPQL